jgi:hypothetical protein
LLCSYCLVQHTCNKRMSGWAPFSE